MTEPINWAPLSQPTTPRFLLRAMFEETSSRRDRDRTEQERREAEAVRRFVTDFVAEYGVTEQMIDDEAEDWWESQAD